MDPAPYTYKNYIMTALDINCVDKWIPGYNCLFLFEL